MLSASANKLSTLKERAEEYAGLIMEELDPENLGYIEVLFKQLQTISQFCNYFVRCSFVLGNSLSKPFNNWGCFP